MPSVHQAPAARSRSPIRTRTSDTPDDPREKPLRDALYGAIAGPTHYERGPIMFTIFTGKYVSLTTFRRDGTPVSTPVWFVTEDGSLLVETDGDSYKVKRIRHNDNVTVASCNAMGA